MSREPRPSQNLQLRVADILLPLESSARSPNGDSERIEEIKSLVDVIVDDLAVLRLRQIWMTIENNLSDYDRLKPRNRDATSVEASAAAAEATR